MSEPIEPTSYEDFLAIAEGDLLQLTDGEDYEGYQKVLHIADRDGKRYLLIGSAEELAAQDGAEMVYCDSTVLTYDPASGALMEVEDPAIFAALSESFQKDCPHIVAAEPEYFEEPVFRESEGALSLADYQNMQAEFDDRYVEEEEGLLALRSNLDLLLKASALSTLVVETELAGPNHPDAKEMLDECATLLANLQGEIFRLSTRLELNLQEVYHTVMLASELRLQEQEPDQAVVEGE